MNQSVDLDAWRKDGERLWLAIQERKLVVIFWNNPWYRCAILGFVLLLVSVVTTVTLKSLFVPVMFGLASLPVIYYAIKFYSIGVRTGGLYSFFSENGFGIGCDADRLSIPYSSIELPEKVSPATVNQNFIILPVKPDIAGIMIEGKNGVDSPWDGTEYKRGIASVVLTNGTIQVKAYPNEMIVHLFCAIYPLSLYLKSKKAETQSG